MAKKKQNTAFNVQVADFISFYSPTQLCGGGTTKSNSNELPISVPLSFHFN